MISRINSFNVPKISFGKLKISEDKKTQNVVQKLESANHIMMGSFKNIDDESERNGYDVVFRAETDKHRNVHFKADAYAYVKVGSYEDVLENIGREDKDYHLCSRNRGKLTEFTYNFPTEVKTRLERLQTLDVDV